MTRRFQSIAVALFSPALCFADARFSDGIRQGEAQQAQIQVLVQRANADLTSIINELNRNGIGGEDVKILGKIRDILGDLTTKDMTTVIALLQEARNAADPSKFRGDATEAVVKQQAIVVKMKQLLLEYKRQQELYELSLRFTELAQRQNGNMKEAKALVRAVKNQAQLDELQRSSKTLQAGEQEGIRDETRGLLSKLLSLAAEADKDTSLRLRKSVEQANKGNLEGSLQSAVEQLKEGKLFLATSAERNSRDRLYELAALVAPVEDTATKLRKAAEKLDKAIAEQKQVIGQTTVLPKAAAGDEAYMKVEDKEADNVDLTDRLRKDLEVIAPNVTDVLKLGQAQMQKARGALNQATQPAAVTAETEALAKLEEARKLLDTQIAKADAEKPTGDKLERAKELKEKLAQLKKDQEALNEQTKAATPRTTPELAKAEAKLQQTAKDIQLETAAESVPAADEISDAAREMDQAREKLDKSSAAEAQPPEKSAVDHLANAAKLLDQQVAKLEKEKDQLGKLEESRDKVAKLIQAEEHVALDTAKEAGEERAKKDTPNEEARKDQANQQIAKDQDAVEKKAEEAKASLPEEGKDAAKPLDESQKDMKAAEKSLADKHADEARPSEQKAIANLNKAKDALEKKIAELQKDLGQPQDNANKLDDLAKALEKAQSDLNKTQDQMQHDPVKELAKQQKKIADDLQKKQEADPASPPLAAAKDAAKSAADELAKNDLPKAIQEMKKAQDAIEQADLAKPDAAKKELGDEQAAVKRAAEQLAETPSTDKQLGKVAADVTNAAADDKGALPQPAKEAIDKAQAALNDAAEKAKAGEKPEASEKTGKAQDALAEAQAAVALAQQGMQPGEMADAKDGKDPKGDGPPGEKGKPGQEKGKGQGKGKGESDGPPPEGPVDENIASKGKGDRKDTHANANDGGPRGNVAGVSNFVNLPARERQAIQQTQKDKYPEEYGPAIEQYLKNLSDQEK